MCKILLSLLLLREKKMKAMAPVWGSLKTLSCYQNIKIQNLSFYWVVCVSLILVSAPRYDHIYILSWGYIALVQRANVGSPSICNIHDVYLFSITWLYKEFVKRVRKHSVYGITLNPLADSQHLRLPPLPLSSVSTVLFLASALSLPKKFDEIGNLWYIFTSLRTISKFCYCGI